MVKKISVLTNRERGGFLAICLEQDLTTADVTALERKHKLQNLIMDPYWSNFRLLSKCPKYQVLTVAYVCAILCFVTNISAVFKLCLKNYWY